MNYYFLEYQNFIFKHSSVEVSTHKKTNFDLAYCYSYVNRHARLVHVNRNLKFVTQKLEALHLVQLNMQKQT